MRRFSGAPLLHFILAVQLGVAAASEVPEGRGQGPLAAIDRALTEAEAALEVNELEIAESRYRDVLLEGWLLLGALENAEGRLEDSKESYRRAARSAVASRRARTALALTELQLDDPQEAIAILRGLAAEGPTDGSARRLLARALVAAGELDSAIQELEELSVLAPEDLVGAYTLATLYLRQDRVGDAESLFARLAAARPTAETHVLIGRTLRDHGEYERAREALETALEIDGTVERGHFYLGTLGLLQEGRGAIERSIEHFRRELELHPGVPRVAFYLGLALTESRRYEEAVIPLEAALQAPTPENDALQFLGRCYLALDRPEEAVAALERALALAEAQPKKVSAGEMTDLRENRIATLNYQLAQALRRSGREAEATVHFEAAKESSARLAESSRHLLARYLRGDSGEATWGGEMASDLPPGIADADPTRRDELRRGIVQALAHSYSNLGVLDMRVRRFSRAAAEFGQAARLDPDSPRIQSSLGVALFNAESFGEAILPLQRALDKTPGDADLRRMLAFSWLQTEHYEEAAALLESDPERQANPSLEYSFGLALVRSGRASEAEAIFGRLLEANADWPELNVVLGQAYAQQGDYAAAADALRRALALDPRVAQAQSTLGEMYLRQGELAMAEEALRGELAAHPHDLRSMYILATVLDLRNLQAEALEVLESLLAAAPGHADAHYLSGKILLAQGAPEEALEQLSAAAGLSPRDPNVRYQLGQALLRLGRQEEARREFERFRALKAVARPGEGS